MSVEQNPVCKGCDNASNSAKTDAETKINTDKSEVTVPGELWEVVKGKRDALTPAMVDKDAGGQPDKEIDNIMENIDIADDPNETSKAKTKPKTIINKNGATATEDTVEVDEVIEDLQSADIIDDIIDQDQLGLLRTMEQLDIAEAEEDSFNEPNSEVSSVSLDSVFLKIKDYIILVWLFL